MAQANPVRYSDLGSLECSVARPVALLGDRWTLIVLRDAFLGIRRFDEFQERLGISRRLLSDRLTKLVDAGIFERRPYDDGPRIRYEYRLTAKGLDVFPVLLALRQFADKHLSPDGVLAVSRHKGCTGVTHLAIDCTECKAELSARDVIVEHGPGHRSFRVEHPAAP